MLGYFWVIISCQNKKKKCWTSEKKKCTFHSDGNGNDYVFDRSWWKIWEKDTQNVKKKA